MLLNTLRKVSVQAAVKMRHCLSEKEKCGKQYDVALRKGKVREVRKISHLAVVISFQLLKYI
jgi:hypothetical protein